MTSIEITDRSEMLAKLEQALALDPRQTAIVTIDCIAGTWIWPWRPCPPRPRMPAA
jgi:hypothetical protein